MAETGDVVVLAGGISHERDVSLRSGRRVADSLRGSTAIGSELARPDASLLGVPARAAARRGLAGAARRQRRGRRAPRPARLRRPPVRRVARRRRAPRLGQADRQGARRARPAVARRAPSRSPREVSASSARTRPRRHRSTAFPDPLVVKPARGGSAQGVTVVDEPHGLPRAMVDAYTYCGRGPHRAEDRAAPRSPSASSTRATAPSPCPRSRSCRSRASTASRRGTTPGRPASTRPPASTPRCGRGRGGCRPGAHAALGLRHLSAST